MEYILEVKYKGKSLKGILINETKDYLVLKLSSGYNSNLKKDEVEIILKTKQNNGNGKNILFDKKEEDKKKLPKITVLHTGGTIASKVDYRTGAVSSKFTVDELMNLFPELNKVANIDARMLGNLFSEDMRFEEYNLMLVEIEKAIKSGSCGVIISHGTDTLHYTSASLQYAMKNLPIPIILVGAQRSSDRASSDAFSNLDVAVDFLVESSKKDIQFRRVGICMHDYIDDNSFVVLDGINVKKMHSTRRDAFKQINYLPFARVHRGKFNILRDELLSKKKGMFSFVKFDTNLKIGFFKAHPNVFSWEIDMLKKYDGVILEGTGVGNIAENENNIKKDGKILKALSKLSTSVKIIAGVQTVYGEVSLDIYSRGKDIQQTGIVGNRVNLITETLFCRIAYVLSCRNENKYDFDKLWNSDLEGFKIRSSDIGE